jgi:hypothetical protein
MKNLRELAMSDDGMAAEAKQRQVNGKADAGANRRGR